MKFKVGFICGKYVELSVDAIESGTLDSVQAKVLALELINAAQDLLFGVSDREGGELCCNLHEEVSHSLRTGSYEGGL